MTTEPVTLIGGFRCRLTVAEQNKWHEFAASRAEAIDYKVARLMFESLASAPQHNEWGVRDAAEKVMRADMAMFSVAAEWYAELRKNNPIDERFPWRLVKDDGKEVSA